MPARSEAPPHFCDKQVIIDGIDVFGNGTGFDFGLRIADFEMKDKKRSQISVLEGSSGVIAVGKQLRIREWVNSVTGHQGETDEETLRTQN